VLAARLRAAAAATDALVARLGGDEFAVISTAHAAPDEAQSLAEHLLTVFDEPVEVAGTRLRLGGSLGIALGPRHGETGSDLLRHADIAMYAAKSSSASVRMFSPDLVEVSAGSLTLATDLRDALARDEIHVAVQPLIELASGRVHSVEVLARWRHPELGEIAPAEFFAAAERSGQVAALSARILDRALALCRRSPGLRPADPGRGQRGRADAGRPLAARADRAGAGPARRTGRAALPGDHRDQRDRRPGPGGRDADPPAADGRPPVGRRLRYGVTPR
jgi:predicted signal transduction protein with EAL and GGDEF domain